MSEEKSNAALPLPPRKKSMVQWGCVCLMLSIAMFGLSLATIQEPILAEMDGMSYFSLLSVLATLGLAIMTPIGGKLGDLFGRRNQVLVAGGICAACALGMGFLRSLWPFLILRLLLGAAQGAFTSAPYILLREINEPQDVPKNMGLMASSVALGSFGGSIIAGVLTDLGWLTLAIIFPVVPLLAGIILIVSALPMQKPRRDISLDWAGIVALTAALSALLLALNFAPRVGWTSPAVLLGFAVGAVALFLLRKAEQRAKEPVIPLRLFRNRTYTALLGVSFLSYFYNTAMNYYAPLAVLQVLGASTSITGTLQLPRTILTVLLPTACGIWVSKRRQNNWMAMAAAVGLCGVAFLSLSFTERSTPLLLFYVMLALTGISESLRSVSVTPAAQQTLAPQDMGIGTSLLSFSNSLSNLLASATLGIVYDLKVTDPRPAAAMVANGVNAVFLLTALVSFAGLALVLLVVRRQMK